MPRPTGIRWNNAQVQKLNNIVDRWNKTLSRERSRLRKQGIDPSKIVPKGLSKKSLRKSISTAKELNAFVRQTEKRLEQGVRTITNKRGVSILQFQLAEIQKQIDKINRDRNKRKKLLNPSDKTGTLSRLITYEFQPKQGWEMISERNWSAYLESLRKQSSPGYYEERDNSYKENYIQAIKNHYPGSVLAEDLIESLQQLSGWDMLQAFYSSPMLQIGMIYPVKGLDMDEIFGRVYNAWMDYLNEKIY